MIGRIKKFFTEVTAELKKVSWTTRQELVDATKVVLISSLMLGVFIAVIDVVLAKLLGIMIR